MSRDINKLHPKLAAKVTPFIEGCKERGIDVIITCTDRTYKTQVALYAQGRQPLEEVNTLRRIARMGPINSKQNKKRVTWTLASRHIPRLDDSDPKNDMATAFDYCVTNKGKAVWDVKASLDDDEIPDYLECAEVAKELGLEAGGFWKKPDFPHIQLYYKDIDIILPEFDCNGI